MWQHPVLFFQILLLRRGLQHTTLQNKPPPFSPVDRQTERRWHDRDQNLRWGLSTGLWERAWGFCRYRLTDILRLRFTLTTRI